MNSFKKILIGALALVALVVGIGLLSSSSEVSATADLPMIHYTAAFDQDPDEYFVYFWNAACSFCQEFDPDVMEAHRAGAPIFVVDMANEDNQSAWYDWEGHHERFTTIVGDVVNGEIIFHDGLSEDQFPTEEGWAIHIAGTQAVAELQRAQNNTSPSHSSEIEVAGTPTLLRIVNGEFVGYGFNIAEGQALFATYGQ